MLKSSLVLVGGRASEAILRFLRNIILARLIGVEDYGIAGTFLIVLSFIELLTDLALDRLIVQDRDGASPRFVATIQALMVLRAIVMSAVLFVLAGVIADLFNQPDLIWAYQLFAVIPLIRGLYNVAVVCQQRDMRFGKEMTALVASLVATLVVVAPMALLLEDYRVILVILVVENLVRSGVSLAISDRPFRLAWDGAVLRRALAFGAPLTLSGLMMFFIAQGDRVAIATQFTAHDLGLFTAAVNLMMVPYLLASRISASFFNPLLSRQRDNPDAFSRQATIAVQAMLLMGGLNIVGFAVLGPPVFLLGFGPSFAGAVPFLVPLATMFGVRLARQGFVSILLARGRTTYVLMSNVVRALFLPLLFVVAALGGSVWDVIAVGLVGEVVTFIVSAVLVTRRLHLGAALWRARIPLILGAGLAVAAMALPLLGANRLTLFITTGSLLAVMGLFCPDVLKSGLRQIRARTG
ncbi:oligosaccharide flippase family protein [Roseospira marina]|uniref:Oligosaccharide flippase family protein n=1 Tax=Roseospira marina TaxID=140057 RepID=A0A5M6IFP3_9PROT|nr:oligosaccharide flippase family protein [Roseospira marina]KAA5607053.1 oligosaccharide flippase family protein [Roseospira marina]MBB4312758.1 O-antigen/teichoic acid export membrane protein [Roseospira marina]MBB5086469.1 O-antigen/teichoic acid export membrane protein [Roseospira marina]